MNKDSERERSVTPVDFYLGADGADGSSVDELESRFRSQSLPYSYADSLSEETPECLDLELGLRSTTPCSGETGDRAYSPCSDYSPYGPQPVYCDMNGINGMDQNP